MRATFQILVIPYILTNSEPEYAIFQTKQGYWQFIAGGGEDNETHLQAAKREASEEAAITSDKFIALDTNCSVPKIHFRSHANNSDIYVIQEYAFGVLVENKELTISREHVNYKWCNFETATDAVKYDSNKTALWELNERIKDGKILR